MSAATWQCNRSAGHKRSYAVTLFTGSSPLGRPSNRIAIGMEHRCAVLFCLLTVRHEVRH